MKPHGRSVSDFQRDCPLPDLTAELARLVNQVPSGCVTTYGDLARALGDVAAARWVGTALLRQLPEETVPSHRVIRSNGELGGYVSGDPADKQRLLAAEGIVVRAGQVERNTDSFTQFDRPDPEPLALLEQRQREWQSRLVERPLRAEIELVGGVDVAYPKPGEARAAFSLVDAQTKELLWSTTVRSEVRFPYISGYLAFRELPILLALWEKVRSKNRVPDVVLVDGNGRLHPRRMGIACHFGVLIDHPTLGVGKRLLCGQVDLDRVTPAAPQPVLDGEEVIGLAVKATSDSRPIYVSSGHLTTLQDAAQVTTSLFAGHRIPEPVYWADRLSKEHDERTE